MGSGQSSKRRPIAFGAFEQLDNLDAVRALAPPAGARGVMLSVDAQAVRMTGEPAGTNLLAKNASDIETDTVGWSAAVNCSIARSVAQAFQGAASLSLTATAGGNMTARTAIGTAGRLVHAGLSYAASAYFRAATVARDARVSIRWYDSAGTFLSASDGTVAADTTTGWTRASVAATAPAGAVYAAVDLTVLSAGAAEVHYADAVQLEAAAAASAFVAGTGPSASVGIPLAVGDLYALWGDLSQVRLTEEVAGAVANIQYLS